MFEIDKEAFGAVGFRGSECGADLISCRNICTDICHWEKI